MTTLRPAIRRFGSAIAVLALAAGAAAWSAIPAAAADTAPVTHLPPAATLYQAYSAAVISGEIEDADIAVFVDSGTGPVQIPPAASYALNNGLVFNPTTGLITRSLTPTDTTALEPAQYTIIVNNGVGGATGAVPATDTTPDLGLHDVMVQFRIPVYFADVSATHQFAGPIYRMAAAGLTSGSGSGAFWPGRDVTRQEFARFITGYLNQARTDLGIDFTDFGLTNPLKTGTCLAAGVDSQFPDVVETNPFCADIQQLAAMGISVGYETTEFKPTAQIKRQEMAAMMYRAHLVANGFSDPAVVSDAVGCTTPIPFPDVTAASVFCGHIEWMYDAEITEGYPDGTFRPLALSTRAMTLAFLDRMGAADNLTGFGAP